jgi:hypothetical protein
MRGSGPGGFLVPHPGAMRRSLQPKTSHQFAAPQRTEGVYPHGDGYKIHQPNNKRGVGIAFGVRTK